MPRAMSIEERPRLVPASSVGAAETVIPQMLPWMLAAGQPYFSELFGGDANAERTVAKWMTRPSSELFWERAMVLVDEDDRVLGGSIEMLGSVVNKCRIADTMELLKRPADEASAIRERIKELQGLFLPIRNDDFYLSKFGVIESMRMRGLGPLLFEAQMVAARSSGARQIRLETTHPVLVRFYERAGFEVIHRGSYRDGKIEYVSMQLEL